jgi:hypothetical protein
LSRVLSGRILARRICTRLRVLAARVLSAACRHDQETQKEQSKASGQGEPPVAIIQPCPHVGAKLGCGRGKLRIQSEPVWEVFEICWGEQMADKLFRKSEAYLKALRGLVDHGLLRETTRSAGGILNYFARDLTKPNERLPPAITIIEVRRRLLPENASTESRAPKKSGSVKS